ncbi:PhaM family polyhydroxyalkanoate granule multifunctional regulatory protein [Comamonas endophytica]|uniref:Transcriptional regulator n=1 Tax=Comamonas endophytica TaxID=2949090 RepID=A0ABY6GDK5_9BURK|nr:MULTISPECIES: PhaM family polyhydroxyalkanoate granule multifunctional regulatory protein [unclassified Acidovorax]MCD2512687.1 hypothetical protein [Acidovorax sp. D4N7]UYG52958.1 hypothetical protein M9799_06965 [Acidovorax sp. 5MLIR]
MSNTGSTDPFGFGKFIPGFDFLQSLSQGAAAGAAAGAGAGTPPTWVAPTMSVEDIDKRIQELRAVQFWLEQNGRALTATIQALEVQKMTLAALQSMQGGISEWAKASAFKMPEAGAASAPASAPSPSAPPPAPATAPPASASAAEATAANGAVDPLQWWGALTQQFQQIATQAMQEPANQKAMEAGAQMATEFTRNAMQSAADLAKASASASAPAPASEPEPTPTTPPKAEPATPAAKAARKTPRRAS